MVARSVANRASGADGAFADRGSDAVVGEAFSTIPFLRRHDPDQVQGFGIPPSQRLWKAHPSDHDRMRSTENGVNPVAMCLPYKEPFVLRHGHRGTEK